MEQELSNEKWEVFIGLLSAYSSIRDYIMSLFENSNWQNDDFLNNIHNLLKFLSERSITISVLVQNNLLWDAQIIMRTVLETSMKIFYLCNCSATQRKERLKEYLLDLEEINCLKQSELAKRLVLNNSHKEFTIQFLPMILDETKEKYLKTKWNRKSRKALEQKWSFHEMLKEQSSTFKEFENILSALAHPYKMSSHLIHADETGIGIVAERSLRSEQEKNKIELHHFCSLLKYSLDQLLLCGFTFCNLFEQSPKPLLEIYDALGDVFDKMELYRKDVFDDPDYDKFK